MMDIEGCLKLTEIKRAEERAFAAQCKDLPFDHVRVIFPEYYASTMKCVRVVATICAIGILAILTGVYFDVIGLYITGIAVSIIMGISTAINYDNSKTGVGISFKSVCELENNDLGIIQTAIEKKAAEYEQIVIKNLSTDGLVKWEES